MGGLGRSLGQVDRPRRGPGGSAKAWICPGGSAKVRILLGGSGEGVLGGLEFYGGRLGSRQLDRHPAQQSAAGLAGVAVVGMGGKKKPKEQRKEDTNLDH